MNSCPMEAGDENLPESRPGKSYERIGSEDRQKDAGHPTLPIRPHGTKGDVALASRLTAIDSDKTCL